MTKREITLTNNQPYPIALFHRVVHENLHPKQIPRVAVYLPNLDTLYEEPVGWARYRVYVDRRANMPYYIYRISGVEAVKSWRALVSSACSDTNNYGPILQGFFAGEGNVREGAHHSRLVRIAQGAPHALLETMLRHFRISFKYGGHREYSISGRDNFEIILALGVTRLHHSKHKKFLRMMQGYRQRHYPCHALHGWVLAKLSTPRTTEELAIDLSARADRGSPSSFRTVCRTEGGPKDGLAPAART